MINFALGYVWNFFIIMNWQSFSIKSWFILETVIELRMSGFVWANWKWSVTISRVQREDDCAEISRDLCRGWIQIWFWRATCRWARLHLRKRRPLDSRRGSAILRCAVEDREDQRVRTRLWPCHRALQTTCGNNFCAATSSKTLLKTATRKMKNCSS